MSEAIERSRKNKELAGRIRSVLERCGIKIHECLVLGSFLHIDTNKEHEDHVIQAILRMGGTQISVSPKGSVTMATDHAGNLRKFHRVSAKF